MALTTLDPNTALIVIDLQKGIIGLPLIHDIDGVIGQAQMLARGFRDRGLPVVLVNVTGTAPGRTEQPRMSLPQDAAWSQLIAEMEQQPGDILVTKTTWGAFPTTDLEAQLKARAITQVVICGVATATGVEATARQAYEAGFNVTLAVDAMTDRRAEAHDYSLRHVFPRLGECATSQEIIAMLPAGRL